MKIETLLTEANRYYTDSEIGAKLDADQVMVNNWRHGKSKPSYKSAIKIRKFHIWLIRSLLTKGVLDSRARSFMVASLSEFQLELQSALAVSNEITVALIAQSEIIK
ncbi:hypothetical protein BH11ARM1_BH11ARM1_08520 [soil metagenome]